MISSVWYDPEAPLASIATLHRTMLIESMWTRLILSTIMPTGITATAPTRSVTELSNPTSVLPIWSWLSSWGATAPIVEVSALASASTPPKRKITRARAGPPTAVTACACTRRPLQRRARVRATAIARAACPVKLGLCPPLFCSPSSATVYRDGASRVDQPRVALRVRERSSCFSTTLTISLST